MYTHPNFRAQYALKDWNAVEDKKAVAYKQFQINKHRATIYVHAQNTSQSPQ